MKSISYDPKVLQEVANNLYAQAASVQLSKAVVWGIALGGVAFIGSTMALKMESGTVAGVAGLVVGALMGAVSARAQVLELKARAQDLLCQMKIEENTRPEKVPVDNAPFAHASADLPHV